MLENVLDKDFVRRFLIEQKHTYEELVTEFKARHPNLKGCSLRSVKRFCNHQGIKKRMPVLDEALSLRALLSTSRRKNVFFDFLPMKRVKDTCFKDSLVAIQFSYLGRHKPKIIFGLWPFRSNWWILICKLRSKRRLSSDHACMKNISAEVSIFRLWTKWRHLVICSKIEFRELYYSSRCALDKISEIYTFDRCPHGWSSQTFFWLVATHIKKKLENNWTIFETCVLTLFMGKK